MKQHKLTACLTGLSFLFVLAAAVAQQKSDEAKKCPMSGQEMKGPSVRGGCPMMAGQAGRGKACCATAGQAQGMKAGGCCCCAGCPMMNKDVERKIENTPDGVVIRLTSKNPETVKKLQEHVAKMASGCCGGTEKGGCQKPVPTSPKKEK